MAVGGGPGRKRAKNSTRRGDQRGRETPLADEPQQMYARVTTLLGSGRARAKCSDGVERPCRVRGTMRRREWVRVGDVVLVSLRDGLAGDVADIVFKYSDAELQQLKKLGEPVHIAIDEEEAGMEDIVTFATDEQSAPAPLARATVAAVAADDADVDWEHI